MMTDLTAESFDEATKGPVLVDVWGPDCQPCLVMMPAVEALGERFAGRVRLLKLNGPDNRKLCRDLRVAGLPTYITLRDGGEVERLTGDGVTVDQLEAAVERLLDGAPVVGLPVPGHLR
jgi:thioredoxin 1